MSRLFWIESAIPRVSKVVIVVALNRTVAAAAAKAETPTVQKLLAFCIKVEEKHMADFANLQEIQDFLNNGAWKWLKLW